MPYFKAGDKSFSTTTVTMKPSRSGYIALRDRHLRRSW